VDAAIGEFYQRLYGRGPSTTEIALGKAALEELGRAAPEALPAYLQVLLSANEFTFVD
jgi:hypothetical protein